MHKFLRAAGFSEYDTEGPVYRLIRNIVAVPDNLSARLELGDGCVLFEYRMPVNSYIGLCAAIVQSGSEFSEIQYYYPYFNTGEIFTEAVCTVERHTPTETYSGIIDEYNIALSLIFFISNPLDYRLRADAGMTTQFRGTSLTAFANEATILLPVVQNEELPEDLEAELEQERLMAAARNGDESAIETLTASDIDMYQEISERIESEDLYSLVDQSFMPCGVECDQYSVIGVITELADTVNEFTGEALWLIRISGNDVEFWMCMRKEDLLGEPMKGRRIKCRLWMTGRVNMSF